MKLNRKWINEEFVDLSHVSDKEYVEKLTVFGQKVETYERMDAQIKNVVVAKVGLKFADVDTNHPMAGKTLTFDIEIIEVRAAEAEEIAHGHVHGPGGHHH